MGRKGWEGLQNTARGAWSHLVRSLCVLHARCHPERMDAWEMTASEPSRGLRCSTGGMHMRVGEMRTHRQGRCTRRQMHPQAGQMHMQAGQMHTQADAHAGRADAHAGSGGACTTPRDKLGLEGRSPGSLGQGTGTALTAVFWGRPRAAIPTSPPLCGLCPQHGAQSRAERGKAFSTGGFLGKGNTFNVVNTENTP